MLARPLLALTLAAGCAGPPFAAAVRVTQAPDVDDVAADARGAVFVASGLALSRHDGAILAVDPDGTIATLAADLDDPRQLVLTATDVYFLTDDGAHRIARGGGSVQQLATLDHPKALAVDGSELVIGVGGTILAIAADGATRALVTDAGDVVDLALAREHLVWVDRSGGRVVRARRDGTEVVELAGDQAEPVALALAGDVVAWITQGSTERDVEATVATAPLAGGPTRVLFRRGYEYEGLAIDRGWVYWTWGDMLSSVHRVRLRGGGAQAVVSDRTDLDGVALDPGGLWVGAADGLYRAHRR